MTNESRPAQPLAKDHRPRGGKSYRVRDGDDWGSIATKFGIGDPAELIRFNFETDDPAEVDWYLREHVGCVLGAPDGSHRFSKAANPGIIHVPPSSPASPIAEAARAATAHAAGVWLRQARVAKGEVQGATGLAQGFVSPMNFEMAVSDEMKGHDVSPETARGFAAVVADVWRRWFGGLTMTLSYPSLGTHPGAVAPPTPNIPAPLSAGRSAAAPAVRELSISFALEKRLRPADTDAELHHAIYDFARWFSLAFRAWLPRVKVQSALAQGPVPSFGPNTPAGPVVDGKFAPTPCLITKSQLGDDVPEE